jgi:iron complex outermembrane receptor protein
LLVLTAIAAETKRSFDLPAGLAAQTLKQFAAQAGREIVFSTELIGDVRTPLVRGELTPNDALLALLAGTGLIAGQDSRTGAIAVRKEADPNAVRAAPLESRDRPATATGRDSETVELSPFVVNTARDVGYLAENTLAGSRLNSNLSDLAASITAGRSF